ncbi:unnamed protein product [Euphydryas editha]|uniref:RNase NYN domain-containing protein n=1 Tax=Euphydryas editha TaxID=104508 RepID=A0AAU9UEH0_EUPED|nr:unnamed protein product [Euphydryas editha]
MRSKSKSSRRSKSLGSQNSVLNVEKRKKLKRKNSKKSKKSIKKLFDHLRNESTSSSSTNLSNCTVVEVDNQNTDVKSTLIFNKPITNHDSLIVIEDDDLHINNELCPIQCSTPLSHSKHVIKSNNTPNTSLNNNSVILQNFTKDVENSTKEINRDSYLTIDLTNDSSINTNNQSHMNTVIDLVNASDVQDCTITNDSLSMSGDSDVTVLNTKRRKTLNSNRREKYVKEIKKMGLEERGELLEFLTKTIFNGCNRPNKTTNSLHSIKNGVSRATETVEDTYIKEVILGQASSRNSIGSNIYNPERDIKNKTGLRMVVIDGSNVAMQHTRGRIFSVKGLKICIDYFLKRGHVVKAFVPHFRCKYGKSTDGKLLDQLERQGLVVYTPSREIQGRMITSYDDR